MLHYYYYGIPLHFNISPIFLFVNLRCQSNSVFRVFTVLDVFCVLQFGGDLLVIG